VGHSTPAPVTLCHDDHNVRASKPARRSTRQRREIGDELNWRRRLRAAALYAQSVISKCGLSTVAGTPQTADALFDNLLTLEDRLDSLDEEQLERETSQNAELEGEFSEAVGE